MNKIIAVYLRYSKDDYKEEDTESINNQRKLIKSYINSHEDLKEYQVEEFCEDGFTGVNMERPAFKKLLELVMERKVHCIIVRDFSRLGRNAADVTELLESTFPMYDVRVISLDDGFDNDDVDFGVITTNIINELYSRNLSNNLKTVIKDKMINGKYKHKVGFFGYRKDNNGQLTIDENAAEVVKSIYNMFISGKCLTEIARTLNDENVPTPYKYKKMYTNEPNTGRAINYVWYADTVKIILSDERYTGKFVGGKTSNNIGTKLTRIPEDKWIKINNHHEAIISEELFKTVKRKFKTVKKNKKINKSLFAGKLICTCGYRLFKKKKNYICRNINCKNIKIKETELKDMLLPLINSKIEIINKNIEYNKKELIESKKSLDFLKRQKLIEKNKLFSAFEDYNDENISIEVYKKKKFEIAENLKNIDDKISLIELNLMQKKDNVNHCAITEISREVIERFVKAIYLQENNKYKIEWK